MAYTFKSRASPSVILLRANGDELLQLIGRPPSTRGVIEAGDLPAAIAAIEAAIVPRGPARPAVPAQGEDDADEPVALRQRALPFLDLLRSAQATGEPVTWGVV